MSEEKVFYVQPIVGVEEKSPSPWVKAAQKLQEHFPNQRLDYTSPANEVVFAFLSELLRVAPVGDVPTNLMERQDHAN